jgi:hypothetical protein
MNMKTNAQLLSKAEQIAKMAALPTIVLVAQEADKFLDYMIDESVLKNNARIVRMTGPEKNIRAIGFGSGRFLKPAATFSSSDYKKTWTDQKLTLVTSKVRGCVAVFDDDLEDGIDGAAFKDHLLRMVATKVANEIDEAAFISDKHGLSGFASTDIRSLWDGWRYQVTHSAVGQDYYNAVTGSAHILDAAAGSDFSLVGGIAVQDTSAPYNWEFKYSKMLKTMPSKYKKGGIGKLRFWQSDQVTQDYINALAARSTVLGDQAIIDSGITKFAKVPLVDCPLLPTDLDANGVSGAGSYTDVILTPADNFVMGVQREITIESQREAADEATYWFYSMRLCFLIENVDAVVLTKKLVVA